MKINPLNVLKGLGASFVVVVSLLVMFGILKGFNNPDQLTSSLTGATDKSLVNVYVIKEVEPDINGKNDNPLYEISTIRVKDNFKRSSWVYDNDNNYPPISTASHTVLRNVPYYMEETATTNKDGLDAFNTSFVCKLTSAAKKVNRVRYIKGTGRKSQVFTIGANEEVVCTFTNIRK